MTTTELIASAAMATDCPVGWLGNAIAKAVRCGSKDDKVRHVRIHERFMEAVMVGSKQNIKHTLELLTVEELQRIQDSVN